MVRLLTTNILGAAANDGVRPFLPKGTKWKVNLAWHIDEEGIRANKLSQKKTDLLSVLPLVSVI
jgi:hypothetical protein